MNSCFDRYSRNCGLGKKKLNLSQLIKLASALSEMFRTGGSIAGKRSSSSLSCLLLARRSGTTTATLFRASCPLGGGGYELTGIVRCLVSTPTIKPIGGRGNKEEEEEEKPQESKLSRAYQAYLREQWHLRQVLVGSPLSSFMNAASYAVDFSISVC